MKPGEMRLVETEFGFHIIRLDGIKSSVPSLASVRPQIEAELRQQQAQKQYAEAADNFGNLVYEQASSLQPAADALKLTIQTSDWMTRQGPAVEPLNFPKVLEAVFAPDSIKGRQNIEPIEIARNVMVAARVIEHRAERQKPVQEVSDTVRARLLAEKTASQTGLLGQKKLAELKLGKEPAGLAWSAFQVVGRQQPGPLDQASLREVMRADAGKLPSYIGSSMPGGAYRIIRITRVLNDMAASPALRSAAEAGLRQAYARADVAAQSELAKSVQKVEIREGALDKKE